MARRRQEGNLFFRLDVDFFSDRKVKILKARYGADGITLYLYLLCEIYKTGYYLKIDRDFEYIVSDDLNMESNKVKQVLNFLLERSLFDNTLFQSDKVLTSAGIQRRYQASFDVKDKSVSEIKEEAVARLRYLSDKVGADMKISLEFCGAPNCSINQFGTAYDVVKAVDRDNVGVTVDTFHFHEMCSRLEDLRAADGKKIFAYHLNDCEDLPLGSCGDDKRLWPGEGVVDHAGIAAALKEIGFDGVCTIEEFRPEYYAMSHEDNVKKAAEVTRDFVQKYFG